MPTNAPTTRRRKKPREPETLDHLLRSVIAAHEITAWATAAGITPYTLLRLRTGAGSRVHGGTVMALAAALDMDEDRVKAAINESRKKGGKVPA